MIATRKGFGKLLAEGTKRAGEEIGGDAPFFAMQVKGQELAMHEPRGKYNVGMGYAISEIGADHLVVAHDSMLASAEGIPFKNAAIDGSPFVSAGSLPEENRSGRHGPWPGSKGSFPGS